MSDDGAGVDTAGAASSGTTDESTRSTASFLDSLGEREPPTTLVIGVFALFSVVLAFPSIGLITTHIPGDHGDAMLNLWIVRAVQQGIPHGWSALWDAPIFHPTPGTLAYSESLIPVALVHWPLRLAVGDTLAFNLIYLAGWTLGGWLTYRLLIRIGTGWGPAFVAALTFAFSTQRLVHHLHFQLVMGWMIPLVLLALIRYLDRPSVARGLALGTATALLTLSASYYGLLIVVALAVILGGWMIIRRPSLWEFAKGLLAGGALAAVLVAPVAYEYAQLGSDPEFRRVFEPELAVHTEDFLSVHPDNYLLADAPAFDHRSLPWSRNLERRLFPGFVALALAVVGTVAMLRRRDGLDADRRLFVWLVVAAGAVLIVLGIGDEAVVWGNGVWMPYDLLRELPGFSGIRATARFALGAQMAMALLAGVGLHRLLCRTRPAVGLAVVALVGLAIPLEVAQPISFARVPTSGETSLADALRDRPEGVVAELPMRSGADGAAWPFVEAPGQYRALADGHRRVNGYSGHQPSGFDGVAAAFNELPDPAGLRALEDHEVRYLVYRTELVADLPDWLEAEFDVEGVGRFDDSTALALIDDLPAGLVADVAAFDGGYLVELSGS